MYRDRTIVQHDVWVEVDTSTTATVMYPLPEGATDFDVVWHDPAITVDVLEAWANEEVLPLQLNARFAVRASAPGRYRFTYAYQSDRIQWDAAYTVTTNADRSRGTVRGALAVRNRLGVPFDRMRTYVIDAALGARQELDTWTGAAQRQAAAAGGEHAHAVLDLGVLDVRVGQTRIPLLVDDGAREIRSVLVYDPIGTTLDSPTPHPVLSPELGARGASPDVTESLEVMRPAHARSSTPPGGVAQLLEQRPDGSVLLLAEGSMYDATTRDAASDTFAIGVASDVAGARERREITTDLVRHRLHEDFSITLTSKRAHPVEVIVREHLYRGQQWQIAYPYWPQEVKEGTQQIAVRVKVPARGQANIYYSVMYSWP